MAKILGIIGGGQLGMMLTEAAKKMPEHIFSSHSIRSKSKLFCFISWCKSNNWRF